MEDWKWASWILSTIEKIVEDEKNNLSSLSKPVSSLLIVIWLLIEEVKKKKKKKKNTGYMDCTEIDSAVFWSNFITISETCHYFVGKVN